MPATCVGGCGPHCLHHASHGQRRDGEHGDPGQEPEPLAEPLTWASHRDEQRAERDRVGVEHPGQGAQSCWIVMKTTSRRTAKASPARFDLPSAKFMG